MRGYVAVTDFNWFEFLRSEPNLDEVNFWQPGGGRGFSAVKAGAPFFFKLKAPYNVIAGFGYFARHSRIPAWLAWESFGRSNGAASFSQMRSHIEKYREKKAPDPTGSFEIGCLMLSQPVFFPRDLWIPQPSDWSASIVAGKTYDLSKGEGLRILKECLARVHSLNGSPSGFDPTAAVTAADSQPRYGEPTTVRPRLGQGTFRVAVTDAYRRACAITQEHSLPVIEAAHIKPYAEGGPHDVSNGLALRADIHRLFDQGYVTVTDKYVFEVSGRLKADFDNGRVYYELHGQKIVLPVQQFEHPEPNFLRWHNETVFKG